MVRGHRTVGILHGHGCRTRTRIAVVLTFFGGWHHNRQPGKKCVLRKFSDDIQIDCLFGGNSVWEIMSLDKEYGCGYYKPSSRVGLRYFCVFYAPGPGILWNKKKGWLGGQDFVRKRREWLRGGLLATDCSVQVHVGSRAKPNGSAWAETDIIHLRGD